MADVVAVVAAVIIYEKLITQLMPFAIVQYFFFKNKQITNGDSELSQEMAEQLSSNHNCHVVLVVSGENKCHHQQDKVDKVAISSSSDGNDGHELLISRFQCNILDNAELGKLAQKLDDNFGGVDLVIVNDSPAISNSSNEQDLADCLNFIDNTSNNIRTVLNVSGKYADMA